MSKIGESQGETSFDPWYGTIDLPYRTMHHSCAVRESQLHRRLSEVSAPESFP